jgi:hypothetical protein
MPLWTHELLTFAILGFASGWLAWRFIRSGKAPACGRSCAAVSARDPLASRARRSNRLKVIG